MKDEELKNGKNGRGVSDLNCLLGTRERKYRVWDGDKLEYFENWHELISLARIMQNNFDNNDFLVTEFTGMKDKNGTEIYEGDIVDSQPGIAHVIYSDGAFALQSPGSKAIGWVHSSVYKISKIVGNIFENPELIDECA